MKRTGLPTINAFERPAWYHDNIAPDAVARWNPGIKAAAKDDETTINILDVIGHDFWTGGGITSKLIAGILRNIGDRAVTVNINSPGGDLFEGIAIYNMFRQHSKDVTVRILGNACSAASIVAMAGDTVQMARSGFLMIHNCWVRAEGNRNDLREFADWLEPFDGAINGIYAARTGLKKNKLEEMMDSETWIDGESAIKQGFADDYLPADQVKTSAKAESERGHVKAVSLVDSILAQSGLSRSERRSLIAEVKSGKPGAADQVTRDAGPDDHEVDLRGMQELIATLKGA